jgi:hypothetical protein
MSDFIFIAEAVKQFDKVTIYWAYLVVLSQQI